MVPHTVMISNLLGIIKVADLHGTLVRPFSDKVVKFADLWQPVTGKSFKSRAVYQHHPVWVVR